MTHSWIYIPEQISKISSLQYSLCAGICYEALAVTTANQLNDACALNASIVNSCLCQSGKEKSLFLPSICILFYEGNAARSNVTAASRSQKFCAKSQDKLPMYLPVWS